MTWHLSPLHGSLLCCEAGLSWLCLHTGVCRTPFPITYNQNPSSTLADHLAPPLNWVLKEPLPNCVEPPMFPLYRFLHAWFTPARSHPVHTECSSQLQFLSPAFIQCLHSKVLIGNCVKRGLPWLFILKANVETSSNLVYTGSVFLQCIGQ